MTLRELEWMALGKARYLGLLKTNPASQQAVIKYDPFLAGHA